MPRKRFVPDLTDLVYQPASELIKCEALKVATNCVTKFHLDEDDEEEIEDTINEPLHLNEVNSQPINDEENQTSSRPMLTLEEHLARRYY